MAKAHGRAKSNRKNLFLLLAGLVLVIAAEGGYLLFGKSGSSTPSAHTKPVSVGQIPAAPPTTGAAGTKTSLGITPVTVEIPSLSVTAPVVAVDVSEGGVLGVPSDPTTVGWWSGGPKPGASIGTAVLTSHVNWDGVPGAFAKLSQIKPGADVVVKSSSGSEEFTVTGVREYQKVGLPAQTVFSQAVAGRLVLITCGGDFNSATGHYDDNVVAYAVPVASAST